MNARFVYPVQRFPIIGSDKPLCSHTLPSAIICAVFEADRLPVRQFVLPCLENWLTACLSF